MAVSDELLKLDVRARLKLIDELWDSILRDLNDPDNPESLPVDDDLRALLDRRRAAYRANPDAGSSWADIRGRLLARSEDGW
jgi:putative addiction module component (TIGR02574 family)